jgi:hypothetical protein
MWFDLVMKGITKPICNACNIIGLLVGPALLVLGPILVFFNWLPKTGAIIGALGCVLPTLLVGYGTVGMFQFELSHAKPLYGAFAIMILIALVADILSLRLVQLAFSAEH